MQWANRTFLGLAGALCAATVAAAAAEPTACEVPAQLTKNEKALCVRAAGTLLPQPRLTPLQIANGPDFDPAHPARSRFAYFTDADTISCYFRPHYAFDKVKGYSLKFQCWHMTPDGAFFSRDGNRIAVHHPKVVITSNIDGQKSASLLDVGDNGYTHEVTPDRVKIKYLSPPSPNQDNRYNEVFTEVAANRFMWLLGFPSDRVYPVGSVSCIGCGRDPYRNGLKTNKASLDDSPVVFNVASVSRGVPWTRIDSEGGDPTWSWLVANRFYADGEWTHQQKVEFDAYRLALGLVHFFDFPDKQNHLVCAEWLPAGQGQPRVCAHPLIYVHDLGSTFGGAKGSFMGTNPRGRFSVWRGQTVFRNPQRCELSATFGGDSRVLKEAQDLMVQRLAVLDATTVGSVFRVARFHIMDREQLARLRHAGTTDVAAAALDEWTLTLLKRADEIRNAQQCRID
jgi:hypothetical protein